MVNAGDTITATCTFMNTGDRPQRLGQYTEDVMCFFYVIAWPMNQLVNGSRGAEGDANACL